MSQGKLETRVFISVGDRLYSLFNLVFEGSRDGSLYIVTSRKGSNNHYKAYDTTSSRWERIRLDNPRPRSKRISYHTTGTVKYHDTSLPDKYFDPLVEVKSINKFLAYLIPSISSLDEYSGPTKETDVFIHLSTYMCSRSIEIDFSVRPCNVSIDEPSHEIITVNGLYSLAISLNDITGLLPSDINNHFSICAPDKGTQERQTMEEDQALISFHQIVNKKQGQIIYPPNGDGIRMMVFSVPMRVPPLVTVELIDSKNHINIVSSKRTRSYLKFIIKNEEGRVLTLDYGRLIKSILLDAEMY